VSAEDLIARRPRPAPASLSRPPDGVTLEQVIGQLQSDFGVPQHPQEFRITLKVAEEKSGRTGRTAAVEEVREESPAGDQPEIGPGEPGVRREKAPAAPRVGGAADGRPEGQAQGSKRRRRGRRRKRGGKPPGGT
jgi:hypothetical protein